MAQSIQNKKGFRKLCKRNSQIRNKRRRSKKEIGYTEPILFSFGPTPKEYKLNKIEIDEKSTKLWDSVILLLEQDEKFANEYMDIAVKNLGDRANSI